MIAHLIWSTATAVVAIAAVFALRKRTAGLRFTILLIAVLRFAIPTPWLSDVGIKLGGYVPLAVMEDLSAFLRHPGDAALPAMSQSDVAAPITASYVATVVWASGAMLGLVVFLRRSRLGIPSVRPANAAEIAALSRAGGETHPVALRIVDSLQTPAALGIWRPCIVLPDGVSAELTETELDAVLAHELAHVRRWDNLWAAATRLITSVLWFHPLLWWMERQMLTEREFACDEHVLARGTSVEIYVAGISKVCVSGLAQTATCAGIGSNLKGRIEHMLTLRSSPSLRFSRGIPTVLGVAALLVPVAAGFLMAQQTKADPSDMGNITGQVELQMSQKNPQAAIEILQAAIARSPERVDLLLALGNIYVRVERYNDAIATYEKALAKAPGRSDILFRLGEAQRRKGDLTAAIAMFERAAAANANDSKAQLQLALLFDGTGQQDRARRAYEDLLKMNPGHGIALNNLAYIEAEDGQNPGRAVSLALEARKNLPDSADVADTLGWAYLKNNQAEQAVLAFRDATQSRFDSATFQGHLAMALERVGNPTPAMQELRALLKGYPSVERDRRVRQLLGEIGK